LSSKNGILTGDRALTKWIQEDATKGTLIQKLINGINAVATNVGASAVGRLAPPPPINGLNVTTGGEYAHITINHSGAIRQGVNYFVEVATNKEFIGAHPIHYGTSRTRDPIHLAPLDSSGAAQSWYARGFAQYPGSDPSEPVVYGGGSPTAIATTGTTRLTWNPSTGSGTSSNNGSQIGWGFGKQSTRGFS
jgi:hypothetical protein